MCRYLSFLFLVSAVLFRDVVFSEVCTKTDVKDCNDCITSGAFCVWCKKLNFTKPGEPDSARCDTKEALEKLGCHSTDTVNPNSYHTLEKNISLNNGKSPVQLAPQEVKMVLRPGRSNTFSAVFKRAQGYPVDLYYLMDLSYSMKDDLKNVKTLGEHILNALKDITLHAKIGFGSFVDKTVLPYTNTNPEKLKKPCPQEELSCQPAFGYKHVLSLTSDENRFNQEVSRQFISGNLDIPEGGLDAIMQAAVCGDKIGWGNNTRLLVYASDAGFHMAGDGKLGAILTPNDGKCHLENNRYTKSDELDYPSVGQLAQKLSENNIQPIFAVTDNVQNVYKDLSTMIPKSAVGVLSSDSSNIVSLIQGAYDSLSSTVILEHNRLPENVKVTYKSKCSDGSVASGDRGICNNVKINDEIIFEVTVTAEKCIEPQSFEIRPLGFTETLTVKIETRCKCECDEALETNSPYCSGSGYIKCGICGCNQGFNGQRCECKIGDKSERDLTQACQRDNGTICSGFGDCVCGICNCHASEDGRKIYGKYCECDDRSCELHDGKICGGHGKCDCGKCICDPNYESSACQCLKSTENCKNSRGNVCSGRGRCECNVCQCQAGYKTPYCEECAACPSPCPKYAPCIECLGFNTGPFSKNCSESCRNIIKHQIKEDVGTKKVCKEKDTENCWMIFIMKELDGQNMYEALIKKERECPEPPNIAAIVGGTVAGVALIGFALLLIWKLITSWMDLKEYQKFEKEKQKQKWSNADNPLFKGATTTVMNPNFSGE
ncbi:integrin beta-2 [Lepisosteus oculatus]|nr:PREDICTED: integrin beta-2 [Lepisosteus oculatus]XP_015214762.1 PREDICTED: integrin beta-2 [Lepisosteus oculatus]